MYDILHVFVKFLGTQHCDKNHYTWFCQNFCCQYITDYRNYGMYDILHVFVKIWSSIKGCIIMKKTFFASQLNMVSNFKEISWDKLNNISYLDFGCKLGI